MVFRDQKLSCEKCGRSYFFTVTEQRRLAEKSGEDAVVPPGLCPTCRGGSGAEPKTSPTAREERTPKPIVEHKVIPVAAEDEFPLEEEGIEVKLIGRVKWFSREKGYGFITKADGQDLFFHRADIVDRDVWPRENQQVEFQIHQTEKGPEAFNVSILPTD